MKRSYRYLLILVLALASAFLLATVAFADDIHVGTVTGSSVNLRAQPSASAAVLMSVAKNSQVAVTGEGNGWYQVIYAGKTGFMSADYVKLAAPADDVEDADDDRLYGYVTGSAVYVRESATTASAAKTSLVCGTKVEILGVSGSWFFVDCKGVQGYMSSSYVSLAQPYCAAVGEQIVQIAMKYLGYRYVWGGASPSTGFDCSGLVTWVFNEYNGFTFKSRTSLYLDGKRVLRDELRPGDLVFFDTVGNGTISHVGIYIGNNQFIHAPNSKSRIRIDTMSYGSYYSARYKGARRIF